MSLVFTPKQVAQALGVSESSVKRWVDAGKLRATKTLGGHRKIELDSVSKFVRETGHQATRPELIGLVASTSLCEPEQYRDLLYRKLILGDERGARSIIVGLYQSGASVVSIGDDLLSPVFRRIGKELSEKAIAVFQERQSGSAALCAVYEVRQLLKEARKSAPVAMCASVAPDSGELPIRLDEAALRSVGWRTCSPGAGLPLEEVLKAAQQHRPRLVCLSAAHPGSVDAIAYGLRMLSQDYSRGYAIAVGGQAAEKTTARALGCDRITPRLSDLVGYAEGLVEEGKRSPSAIRFDGSQKVSSRARAADSSLPLPLYEPAR